MLGKDFERRIKETPIEKYEEYYMRSGVEAPKKLYDTNVKHPAGVEDHALIMLGFSNGKSGIIETNWLTPHKTRTLTAVGTEGIAYLDYIQQKLVIYNDEWEKIAKIERREPLKNEIEHFIECIKENKEPLISGEDGLHVLKVALKALESSKRDEVLEVE